MLQEKALAYLAKDSRYYKPERSVGGNRKPWPYVSLLWGDVVYIVSIDDEMATVSAQGHIVQIPVDDLMPDPLLHVYLIDCGQGDAILVQMPDMKWMVVDGGPPREKGWTNTGKIAFDFLKWKIYRDYSWRTEYGHDPFAPPGGETGAFHIDSIVITHPDKDHFGGLKELPQKMRPQSDPSERITVGRLFHNGMGRFRGNFTKFGEGESLSSLGIVVGDNAPNNAFLATIIDSFDDVEKYKSRGGRGFQLQGTEYGDWLLQLAANRGGGIGYMQRLHYGMGWVPGFDENQQVSVRILGPVEEEWGDAPVLRYIDTASKDSMKKPSLTRNGLSVVLKLTMGRANVLLTGDLNFRSQAVLLRNVPADQFEAQVVKMCHHGSEDVSWKFLKATKPTAVLVSSGDNESHTHPRAKSLGWSGAFSELRKRGRNKSFLDLEEERYFSPLIYSTELARSAQLWQPHKVFGGKSEDPIEEPKIQARGRNLEQPDSEQPKLASNWLLADRMLYGLINVRTDGERILIGVKKENGRGFHTETFAC